MPAVKRFEDLRVWQEARLLVQEIYAFTEGDGVKRDFALKEQVRRAALSIMNNIAEGFDGGSKAEFLRFLVYAKRSVSEVRSVLYVALDRHYLVEGMFMKMTGRLEHIRAMLLALMQTLRRPRTRSVAPAGQSMSTRAHEHTST